MNSGSYSQGARRYVRPREAETVRQVLEAGHVVLRELGHEQTTMRLIASQAGVSAATAYTYFSSKEHLFAELYLQLMEQFAVPVEVLDAELSVLDRLVALTDALSTVLAAESAVAIAATRALITNDVDISRVRREIGAQMRRLFEVVFHAPPPMDKLETLYVAFHGTLLRASLGEISYGEVGQRMRVIIPVILGNGHDG